MKFLTGGIAREPSWQIRFDFGADSKVWMEEENSIYSIVIPWRFSSGFLFWVNICKTEPTELLYKLFGVKLWNYTRIT